MRWPTPGCSTRNSAMKRGWRERQTGLQSEASAFLNLLLLLPSFFIPFWFFCAPSILPLPSWSFGVPNFCHYIEKKYYWVYLFTSTAELIISLTLMWIQSTFAPWCASESESDFMCFYSFLRVVFIIFSPSSVFASFWTSFSRGKERHIWITQEPFRIF